MTERFVYVNHIKFSTKSTYLQEKNYRLPLMYFFREIVFLSR